jgi:sterol desaturase/sphingolipid hydroxylase (fatty acid hydroxylase superfamily)
MNDQNQNLELIRFIISTLSLFLFFIFGIYFSFRKQFELSKIRWLRNLSIAFLNIFLFHFIMPLSLFEMAESIKNKNWGLFNSLDFPSWINLILSLLLLDCIIYFQHRWMHLSPLLWRLHRLHHTDLGMDTTTALRFHPLEILFSYTVKSLCLLLFGISGIAIIIFEIALNFSALFNHSNFSLFSFIEKTTRFLIVTPDMHRIHHSTVHKEMNSNFGFCLSIWDKLFKTYTESSSQNPKLMPIGHKQYRHDEDQKLSSMLIQPFKAEPTL